MVYASSIEAETFCAATSELDRFEDLDFATPSAHAEAKTHWFRCVGQGLEGRLSHNRKATVVISMVSDELSRCGVHVASLLWQGKDELQFHVFKRDCRWAILIGSVHNGSIDMHFSASHNFDSRLSNLQVCPSVPRIHTALECFTARVNIQLDSDPTWPSSSLMAVSNEGQVEQSLSSDPKPHCWRLQDDGTFHTLSKLSEVLTVLQSIPWPAKLVARIIRKVRMMDAFHVLARSRRFVSRADPPLKRHVSRA